jgi:ribosome biogenesis protein Tsr3
MVAAATALAVFGSLEQAPDFVQKFDWSKVELLMDSSFATNSW